MTETNALKPCPMPPKDRPLAPFFTYRFQLTMMMSIWHRFTGIGLCGGLVLLVAFLVALAVGPDVYNFVTFLLAHWLGQLVLIGMTWALFYHLCNGIRHCMWDCLRGLDLRSVYITGFIVLFLSALLTAAFWLKIYGYLP